MPRRSSNQLSDAQALLVLVILIAVFGWYFRHQIITAIESALVQFFTGLFNLIIALAVILIVGFIGYKIGEALIDNYNISKWYVGFGAVVLILIDGNIPAIWISGYIIFLLCLGAIVTVVENVGKENGWF